MAMSRSEQPSDVHPPATTSSPQTLSPKLWVELHVDVATNQHCPLATTEYDESDGSIQLVGSTCHLHVVADEGSSTTRTVTTPITDQCLCTGLCGDGFAPVELTVEDGSLVIGAYAADRKTLSEATDRLGDGVDRWRLRQLTTTANDERTDEQDHGPDGVTLTVKQREAVQTAVEMGYYDRPRNASLGDLAGRLGVTRSALSQRLNAVESKLITDLSNDL
jgi:hypothetical protein